jgi:hypothetical protein
MVDRYDQYFPVLLVLTRLYPLRGLEWAGFEHVLLLRSCTGMGSPEVITFYILRMLAGISIYKHLKTCDVQRTRDHTASK